MNRIIDVSKARIPSVKIPIDNGGGTANVGDVLATKTFDSESGLLQVGTMPNRTGTLLGSAGVGNGVGDVTLTPPSGYYDGSTAQVKAFDANFIAANIPASLSMFGLAGTGANAKRWATGNVGPSSNSFVISGLAFTPTLIFAYEPNISPLAGSGSILVANKNGGIFYNGATYQEAYGQYVAGSGAFAAYTPTWTSSGATIMISGNPMPYTWYAFE